MLVSIRLEKDAKSKQPSTQPSYLCVIISKWEVKMRVLHVSAIIINSVVIVKSESVKIEICRSGIQKASERMEMR